MDEGLGFTASAPGGVRQPWEFRPPSGGHESYFGAAGDLWSGMVDWWFSHDIPTEGLPSGGGLMVGPQETAKLANFLKDALLPLMAGDIGLAGVGGLGPFDPLPLPFGKVIGEGVKGAKWVVKAVKAVGKGDDVVAGLAKSVPDTPAFYGIERLDEAGWGNPRHGAVRDLFDESGENLRGNARMLSPDDPVIPDVVYHVTASGSDIAEEGVLRVGKDVGLGAGGGPSERLISFTVSREVAERLAADFELRRQIAVAATRGGRDEVGDLLKAESRRWGIATLSPKRREELTSITGFPEGRSIDYEWEYYLHTESSRYDLDEVLSFFFRGRSWSGGPRDPLFVVGADHLKEGRPEPLLGWATKTADDIQILAVPKENLAASGGAVVDFDLGKGFLEEIRVYGDVPVPASGVARETGEAGLQVPMGERRPYPGAMSESGQAPWVDFVLSPAGGASDDMWGKPGRWTGQKWGEGEWVSDEVFGEFDTNADAIIHQLESILGTDETLMGFDMAKDLAFDVGDIDSVFRLEQIIDHSVMKQARMLENPAQETVFRLKKELELYKMMADETPGGLDEWLFNGGVGTDGDAGVDFTADWQDRFMEFVRALGDEPEIFGLDEDDLYRAVSARRPRLWTGEHAFPREELEGG